MAICALPIHLTQFDKVNQFAMHIVLCWSPLVVVPLRIVVRHKVANGLFLENQRRLSCVDWSVAILNQVVNLVESLVC